MTRHEIDKFAMVQTVDELLTNNQTLFQGQPAIVTAYFRLHATVATIFELTPVQASSGGGNTAAKEKQKEEVTNLFQKVQAGVLAHATSTSNVLLKTEATISESSFRKLRQANMYTWVMKLHGLATPIAALLVPWGVSQDDIDSLKSGGDGFRQQLLDMSTVKNLSKEATAAIKDALTTGINLLNDELDSLLLPYKLLNSTFYTQYTTARQIIERAATHTKATDPGASASDGAAAR